MIHSRLVVRLPLEPYEHTKRAARILQWLVGLNASRKGRRGMLIDAAVVVHGIFTAFESAGFNDVIHVREGNRMIYADDRRDTVDLWVALERAVRFGLLRQGLQDVDLLFSRRADLLHTLAHVVVDEQMPDSDVQISLTTRLPDLRVRSDEDPVTYAQRVEHDLAGGRLLADRTAEHTRIMHALANALRDRLPGSEVLEEPVEIRAVVPGPVQIARLRHLRFGHLLRPLAYHPVRESRRTGAYDDPHVHHFFDAYHDLLQWLIVDLVRRGKVQAPGLQVISASGANLWPADAPGTDSIVAEVPWSAVTLREDGVEVDDSVPSVESLDPAEAGSPHAAGWGGGG